MIGHTLAKLYGSVLEAELSAFVECQGHRAPGQVGFRRTFSTLDHIFTLHAIIEESKARSRRVFYYVVDFCKAFDSVPRAKVLRRLQSLCVPDEMIWSITALYDLVIGRVRAPEGMSPEITSTIEVKQDCPLSPTLFGLYIHEISKFVDRMGGLGVPLAGILFPLLLYTNDIVLISDSAEGLQRNLDALQDFCL